MTAAAAVGVSLAGCSSGSDGGDGGDGGSDGGDGGGATTEDGGDGGGSEFEKADTVNMTDELTFSPKKIEVDAGTTVTFKNVGSIGHTVTAYEDKIPDGATYWASGDYESQDAAEEAYESDKGGNIEAGETYEHTFETTGEHEYYCIPHEMNGMTGIVKVV